MALKPYLAVIGLLERYPAARRVQDSLLTQLVAQRRHIRRHGPVAHVASTQAVAQNSYPSEATMLIPTSQPVSSRISSIANFPGFSRAYSSMGRL